MTLKSFLSLAMATASLTSASASVPTVKWETLGNKVDGDRYYYVQRYTITGHDNLKRLCFNQFAKKMHAVTPGDTIVEIVPSYYYLASNRFGTTDQPIVIDVETNGAITNFCFGPDGWHAVMNDGNVVEVEMKRETLLKSPEMRNIPGRSDRLVYADSIYRLNERLKADRELGPFDIVPSFKKVTLSPSGEYVAGKPIVTRIINHDNPEFYRITLTPDSAVIEAPNDNPARAARRVLENRLLTVNSGKLPCAIIEDYPDFNYRGVLIDISRNFQTFPDMMELVERLADYRINRLHFHPIDDEGWRLEIPGLPELTEYGSRRGYTTDERDFLAQIYSGDGNPDSKARWSNGYYTRDQFIRFIQKCDSLGIKVIPEIESPGHARAAIKSMEARFRRTGDDTYRMIEDNDTSKYTTAQYYHDNLMNPALPGTYRFMEKIVDEIAAMYRDAGVELVGIHIGGDEVPGGAWDGSPSAMAMAEELGLKGNHGLQGEFVRRVAAMMKQKGIPVYGWQEIGTGYDDAFNAEVAPAIGGINCWQNTLPGDRNVALRARRAGYPVILSNVDYFYLDMLYSDHPEERGLSWGGIVDELQTLSGYPENMCPDGENTKAPILGVQGQVFAETLRGYKTLQSALFPKMLGLAERGWNARPTYSDALFNRLIGERELPRLASMGFTFHMRQPGIIIADGKAVMNSPYKNALIRYTLDGSEPDENSAVYNSPVDIGNASEIRARLYYLGQPSVTSLLYK